MWVSGMSRVVEVWLVTTMKSCLPGAFLSVLNITRMITPTMATKMNTLCQVIFTRMLVCFPIRKTKCQFRTQSAIITSFDFLSAIKSDSRMSFSQALIDGVYFGRKQFSKTGVFWSICVNTQNYARGCNRINLSRVDRPGGCRALHVHGKTKLRRIVLALWPTNVSEYYQKWLEITWLIPKQSC